jgi:Tetracyclin repressor-like, C-terminal domain
MSMSHACSRTSPSSGGSHCAPCSSAADADLDMLVDMAYGVLYYRLLVGHAPLDESAASSLATELTRCAPE